MATWQSYFDDQFQRGTTAQDGANGLRVVGANVGDGIAFIAS